jgi:Transposase, Mutator family
MEKLVETLGITRLSKSQVSRTAADLDEVEAFRTRPRDEAPYTFVAADGLLLRRLVEKRIQSDLLATCDSLRWRMYAAPLVVAVTRVVTIDTDQGQSGAPGPTGKPSNDGRRGRHGARGDRVRLGGVPAGPE